MSRRLRIMTEEQKELRNKRQQRWVEKQDRINFVMPKGTKERIEQAAQEAGISKSEWLRKVIEESLK
jgi:predicted DNA binding CopG/RHH family protein